MNDDDLAVALRRLVPGAAFSVRGGLKGISWEDHRSRPSDAEITAALEYLALDRVRGEMRAAITEAVERVRRSDRLSHAGADWEVTERAEALVQRKAARIAASGTPATITLFDISGAAHTLDQTQFADLVAAADDWLDALHTGAAALRSKVGDLNHDDVAEMLQSVRAVESLPALQALNE